MAMAQSADNLINDLSMLLASYASEKRHDRCLEELHEVAEAAISMLVILRRHQLESQDDLYDDAAA